MSSHSFIPERARQAGAPAPSYPRDAAAWQRRIESWLDIRPEDGVYRIAREAFTEPGLFDLEMEYIFEKTWLFAGHESRLPEPDTFFTMRAGRQPLIVARDGRGELRAFVNACRHRGTTLVRECNGRRSRFSCPFHGWTYGSDGRLLGVKDPELYGTLDKSALGLATARIESYRGFVFVCLDDAAPPLETFLGDTRIFFDWMIEQAPDGELEVVPGSSTYAFDGNWKLQNENGLDGYHVSTVHFNYVQTATRRAKLDADKPGVAKVDYSGLGSAGTAMRSGWFSFPYGHSVLWSDLPNPEARVSYGMRPDLVRRHGEETARWIMDRLKNLNVYPSLFFMEQASQQLRIIRPVAYNRTEVES